MLAPIVTHGNLASTVVIPGSIVVYSIYLHTESSSGLITVTDGDDNILINKIMFTRDFIYINIPFFAQTGLKIFAAAPSSVKNVTVTHSHVGA